MHGSEHMRGILAMLFAVALFSVMDAQLKLLAGHYGPMQVSFLRGATALPFVLLPILLRGRLARLKLVNVRLHLLRGALAVLMLGSFVYAVRESSLATTYSIFMCAPLLVAALSAPLLGERVAGAQWAAIAAGLQRPSPMRTTRVSSTSSRRRMMAMTSPSHCSRGVSASIT